jgi:hypothetical protein
MFSTIHDDGPVGRYRNRYSERRMMKRLFLVVFPLCLVAAVVTRIVSVFDPHGGAAQRSIVAEARAAAHAAIGYTFYM